MNPDQICLPHGHLDCEHCYPDANANMISTSVSGTKRLAGIPNVDVRAWLEDEIDAMPWMALSRRDMALLGMVNLTWVLADAMQERSGHE